MLVALPLGPYVAVIGAVAPLLLTGRLSAVGAIAALLSIATLFANLVPKYWRYDALAIDIFH